MERSERVAFSCSPRILSPEIDQFTLPKRAEADKIEAHLDDGVLRVNIPLTPLPEPKKISISSKKKALESKSK